MIPTKLLAWGLGALIAIAMVIGFWNYIAGKDREIKKTITENVGLKIDNKVKEETIVRDEKSDKVNQAVNLDVAVKTTEKAKTFAKVDKATKEKVEVIEQKFDQLPKTAVNTAEKVQLVSTELIDGLWNNYCAADPKGEGCAQPTKKG